jgi:hypothetical protein
MKAKPIIIVMSTLIIGFVLGMLISGRIRYHRLMPVRIFFSEQRFREGFYNIIQPDDKQKETIEQMLSKYAKVNSYIQNDFRKKLDSLMKVFWKELTPVLSKEQQDRLKEMEKKRNEMIRLNRRNPRDSADFRNMNFDRRRMPPPPPGGMHRPPTVHNHDTTSL